jgi:teichuronic acid biosynthesis glycosyltransferase TuaH
MELKAADIKRSHTDTTTAVIKGRDIVLVSLHPWYFPTGSNSKNIAHHLALHNRVLYVNIPVKRKAYHARSTDPMISRHIDILKEGKDTIYEIAPNLWEYYPPSLIDSVNGLPSTNVVKAVNYLNNRKFAKDIKLAIKKLGFKDIILFNDNDIYNGYSLKKLLSPSMYIYYMRDFLQGYTYWKKHTTKLEPELIRNADLVVTNSQYLSEYTQTINSNSHYIGQGCVLDYFDHTKHFPVPGDIKGIGHPRIGYIGAMDSARLDPLIIEAIAKANPTWQVVMVGPEDEVFKNNPLHSLPNVHFLGGKPFAELASYVQSFDVCINPQLKNQITIGNYPLKIDEYLAMGKPTVATRTLAMRIFENHTYLADTPGQYPALVKQALEENTKEKEKERIRFAKTHTWENCMTELYKAMIDTFDKKNKQ